MKRPQALSSKTLAGVTFLVVVLISLMFIGVSVNRWLHDEQRLPVQQIEFIGERNYIDRSRLEDLVRESQPGSFFALDVNQVFSLLEAQPWIYRASVRKKWPNKLTVYIVEQKPVAHWNDDLLLNQFGETFEGNGVNLIYPICMVLVVVKKQHYKDTTPCKQY
jgi:cell division protein FtsQ